MIRRVLLAVPFTVCAALAGAPSWTFETHRLQNYLNTEWHIGFVRDRVSGRAKFDDFQAIEMLAQQDLSERIMAEIRSSSALRTQTVQRIQDGNLSETTISDFDVNVIIQSSAVLVNVDRRSFFNRRNGTIYGFAAVRKSVLAEFYKSNMNMLFSYIDEQIPVATSLAESGRKIAAVEKIQEIGDSLARVNEFNALLLAVNNDDSFVENIVNVHRRLNGIRTQLQAGTRLFLDISGDNNLSELSAIISQNEDWSFEVVQSRENADYLVGIRTNLSRCTPPDVRLALCHVNADVSIVCRKNQRNVSVQISETRGGFPNANTGRATQIAFENLTSEIAEKVIQSIKEVFFR
ncbi:MAG: hypothetical protein FWE23_10040 [Chitinivibrionia bacterium]|nr:hypothetical protein [Chitinivibrionia bacterium]